MQTKMIKSLLLHFLTLVTATLNTYEYNLMRAISNNCTTSGWGTFDSTSVCSLNGVTCNSVSSDPAQSVISLYLDSKCAGTGNEWPLEIFQLRNLTYINLAGNPFKIPLPVAVSQLGKLQTLNLYGCGLTGSIPSLPSTLTSIEIGNNNNLVGSLSLAGLTGLTYFSNLDSPLSTWNITEICTLTQLTTLQMQVQRPSLANATVQLPSCISGLTLLTKFIFRSLNNGPNQWSSVVGPIDSINWKALSSLITLELGSPYFVGNLPISLPNSLVSLTITNMNVTGSLSSVSWINCTSLTSINLRFLTNLQLGSTPANSVPNGIQTLQIQLAPGTYTAPLASMSIFPFDRWQRLTYLQMGGLFSGSLAPTFAMMSQINYVDLGWNMLSGPLNATNWNNLTTLAYLLIANNQFSTFGNAFSSASNLQQVYLSGNPSISGTFSPFLLSSNSFNQINVNDCPNLDYNLTALCTKTWAYSNCFANNARSACSYYGTCNCQLPVSAVCAATTAPAVAATSVLTSTTTTSAIRSTSLVVSTSTTTSIVATTSTNSRSSMKLTISTAVTSSSTSTTTSASASISSTDSSVISSPSIAIVQSSTLSSTVETMEISNTDVPTSVNSPNNSSTIVIIASAGSAALLLIIAGSFFFYKRYKRVRQENLQKAKIINEAMMFTTLSSAQTESQFQSYIGSMATQLSQMRPTTMGNEPGFDLHAQLGL